MAVGDFSGGLLDSHHMAVVNSVSHGGSW